ARLRHAGRRHRGCRLAMPRVAFIGLGRMGHGMAGRTIEAGFEVSVWNLGKDGAGTTAKPGTLAIECSTVSHAHALELARELRGRGLIYIDCPVTGLP